MQQPTVIKPLPTLEQVVSSVKETLRYHGNIATVRAIVTDIAERLSAEWQKGDLDRAARFIWYDLQIDDCDKWYVVELKRRMK